MRFAAPCRPIARGLRALATTVWGVWLLAGCSTLPILVPDMERPRAEVRLEGSKGVLSAAQSQAILDRLKGGRPDTSLLDRHLAIEEAYTDSPLIAGNKVLLLQDGPTTYAAMLAAIRGATDHIDMETYILDGDEVGLRFVDELIAKQAQGVQVNLIHDSVGTFGTPVEVFKRLADAGVRVLQFNPVNPMQARAGWDVNQRDHRKLLIADGRIALLGGINISSVYSGRSMLRRRSNTAPAPPGRQPWRDTDLQIEGPVVAEFQKLFFDTWTRQKGDPVPQRNYYPALKPQGDAVVRAIGSAPDQPYSLIYVTLMSAIANAEKEIFLTNAYFAPDPQLEDALIAAASRGVDVKLILPGSSDVGLVFHAGRSHYDKLLRGGVRIFERQAALLHAKTAVIDGVWSTVGSTNLDWRSFLHNQELNAVVLGTAFGERMRSAFDGDLSASKAVTLEEWQRRPLELRLKEAIARLWEYWL